MTPQQKQQLFVTETPRLTLRRLVPLDYLEAFAWRGDPRVCKYMAHAASEKPEDFLPWLRQQDPASDQRIICILHEKSDGHAVGNVGFFYHPEEDMWSFAYNIRYEDWNKGYTTEAVQALMDHVREKYGAHTFEAEHAIGNEASGRVMEKCGLSYHHDSEYRNKDTGQVFSSRVYRLEDRKEPHMDIWETLCKKAKAQYHPQDLSPFVYANHVVCALESENGEIFTGFCVESCSGVLNLCAERVAALNMLVNSGQTRIKRLIAFRDQPPGDTASGMPCGACREFLYQLDERNEDMEIMLCYETRQTITLKELMPHWWGKERYTQWKQD